MMGVVCAHMSCRIKWKSEDNFLEPALFFHHTGLNKPPQAWWYVPLPCKPLH